MTNLSGPDYLKSPLFDQVEGHLIALGAPAVARIAETTREQLQHDLALRGEISEGIFSQLRVSNNGMLLPFPKFQTMLSPTEDSLTDEQLGFATNNPRIVSEKAEAKRQDARDELLGVFMAAAGSIALVGMRDLNPAAFDDFTYKVGKVDKGLMHAWADYYLDPEIAHGLTFPLQLLWKKNPDRQDPYLMAAGFRADIGFIESVTPVKHLGLIARTGMVLGGNAVSGKVRRFTKNVVQTPNIVEELVLPQPAEQLLGGE
jgi:lipopolysaccharide/colanic/teichoic acid biosynthesis glycosyltransferase